VRLTELGSLVVLEVGFQHLARGVSPAHVSGLPFVLGQARLVHLFDLAS
jgi:hypothetical protein